MFDKILGTAEPANNITNIYFAGLVYKMAGRGRGRGRGVLLQTFEDTNVVSSEDHFQNNWGLERQNCRNPSSIMIFCNNSNITNGCNLFKNR